MTTLDKSTIKITEISLQEEVKKTNELWTEIKCVGKSIKRRSYHSSVIYKSELYVYGGYDINTGVMSDFHKINLKENSVWIDLTKDTDNYPGPRHGHSALENNGKMIIFGGKVNSLSSTNKVHVYDFASDVWTNVTTSGEQPPNIDAHSAAVHQNKMYVFGGFFSIQSGAYSNTIYSLNLQTFQWSKVVVSGAKSPQPRANSSTSIVKDSLYIFGGTNLNQKFKDLWRFDIISSKWQQLKTKQQTTQIPDTRAGHTLTSFSNKLLLFGGIQNITHQKDDLFVFNVDTNNWKQIQNSDNNTLSQIISNNQQNQGQLSRRVNDLKSTSGKIKKSTIKSIINPHQKSVERERQKTTQISKNQIRKQQLLSQFQLTPQQNQRYRNPSPTLESLKSSIQSINPPQRKKQPDENQTKQIVKKSIRKRPCARDGHTATLFEDHILFMGGDRHLMGFNDLYLLNLKVLEE